MAKADLKKLVLLDAHAIIHRAYHALPDFVSSRGEPTGALYGIVNIILKLVSDLEPSYLVACYDLPDKTFRKQIYEGYKGTRKETEEALVRQLESSRRLVAALGIPIYDAPGFEADDVIGTIVAETKKLKNLQVIIASGDLDTLQLVDGERVLAYVPKKGLSETALYDEAAVIKRFGFKPAYLPDYKGLAGDTSDNIIGVAGVGDKTAKELVAKFGTVEEIYKHLAELTPRQQKLLGASEEEALFSKTLATIRRDAPLNFKLPAEEWRQRVNLVELDELFALWEFRTLGGRVRAALGGGATEVAGGEVNVAPALAPEQKIAALLLNPDLANPTSADLPADWAKQLGQAGLTRVYEAVELPLLPIIAAAETRGILVDKNYLENLAAQYRAKLGGLEQKVYDLAGQEFNLNSPKQLAEVLFDKLNLAVKGLKKTAGGARSTRESELLKLKDAHPIIEPLLEYREYQKLLSTYLEPIPKLLDEYNRLHTKLNQIGAATGRMSSSDPNLQNIPVREGPGRAIRQAFVASPGHRLAAFDYSQIEMRVLAVFSGDENLKAAFREGRDIHTAVAEQVFKTSTITPDQRRAAKVINFGIVYGMGVNALKDNLGTDRATAQKFHDEYFAAFPTLRAYFEKAKREAHLRGFTTTFFGRRRFFPGLKSSLPYIRAMNERMAVNAPLQGTAADLLKLAMIKADKLIAEKGWRASVHFLLPVHDELIYEVEEGLVSEAAPLIKEAMESVWGEVDVPLLVNPKLGSNWGALEAAS
jgi:DNA polymerase-1